MRNSMDKAVARQEAFTEVWAEFVDQSPVRFPLVWDGLTPHWGEMRDEFLETLARRSEGLSLRAFGEKIAGTAAPDGWEWREWKTWLGALGCLGVSYWSERDRAKLVATAELLGLAEVLHENGVVW